MVSQTSALCHWGGGGGVQPLFPFVELPTDGATRVEGHLRRAVEMKVAADALLQSAVDGALAAGWCWDRILLVIGASASSPGSQEADGGAGGSAPRRRKGERVGSPQVRPGRRPTGVAQEEEWPCLS